MVLPDVPVPGRTTPELSGGQLGQLTALFRERGVKVVFEVGGLRLAPGTPLDQAGERTAHNELPHLRRWLAAGGRIDYRTTDHAIMHHLGDAYVDPEQFPDVGGTLPVLLRELADHVTIVRQEIPGVRVGVIESLGYFHVRGPDGRE